MLSLFLLEEIDHLSRETGRCWFKVVVMSQARLILDPCLEMASLMVRFKEQELLVLENSLWVREVSQVGCQFFKLILRLGGPNNP